MQALLLVAVLMQVKMDASVRRDSTDSTRKNVSVGVRIGSENSRRREPRRIPVTEAHLRTAGLPAWSRIPRS
jgi:hypothetical protein